MKRIIAACAIVALAAGCSPPEDQAKKKEQQTTTTQAPTPVAGPIVPAATEAPSGDYTLDKAHSSVVFRVNHIGFSNYTAQFTALDGQLKLDAKDPAKSSVTVAIETKSLLLNAPPAGFLETLLSEKWLGATQHPTMTFRSTKIELTGPNTARITGDFTLRGATQPVTLEATFNGGYAGHPYDPNARIGFSAHGVLKRSAFGVSEGIPPPGSTMGVSDDVNFAIETEWNGPPLAGQTAAQPATGATP